jgi:hypothetical protein
LGLVGTGIGDGPPVGWNGIVFGPPLGFVGGPPPGLMGGVCGRLPAPAAVCAALGLMGVVLGLLPTPVVLLPVVKALVDFS